MANLGILKGVFFPPCLFQQAGVSLLDWNAKTWPKRRVKNKFDGLFILSNSCFEYLHVVANIKNILFLLAMITDTKKSIVQEELYHFLFILGAYWIKIEKNIKFIKM